VRGFAKDYGLNGFKIGFLISCNQLIREKFTYWKKIITPQSYTLQFMSNLLRLTNYGRDICEYSCEMLRKCIQYSMTLLNEYKISYIEPKGTIFLVLDLTKELE
jgi:aspartate/methionine/tyrosine aminotransferase